MADDSVIIESDQQSSTGVTPSPEVRSELQLQLQADSSRLGEVYVLIQEGKTLDEIQQFLGLQYPNFIWGYDRLFKSILNGDLPTAPSVVRSNARRFRSILKSWDLSPDAREVLNANLAILEERLRDMQNVERETEDALRAAATVEAEGISGIYVYVLPHYWNFRYDQDSGRTLLKVGRSSRDVIQRFRNQTRTTALPEEPLLLRIYPVEDGDRSAEIERKFHRLLEAADHDRSRARTGGTEWFLTSLRFLDEVASTLGLEIRQVVAADDLD